MARVATFNKKFMTSKAQYAVLVMTRLKYNVWEVHWTFYAAAVMIQVCPKEYDPWTFAAG
jgi:hypothetical protein